MATRTPTAKFAVPFKSPCTPQSSQPGSQPLRGQLQTHLPPPSDQQQHQKRRCKDILSGLSQDSNISTETFNTPVARTPVGTQKAIKDKTLLLRTPKRCKVSTKDNALHGTRGADGLQSNNHVEVVAKQIGKYHKDRSTVSNTTTNAERISSYNQEIVAKQMGKQSKDTAVMPNASKGGKHGAGLRHARRKANAGQREPDVYEFSMSPTSLRNQRQRIRKLQAREAAKRTLLELIARMHSEMRELRERHRTRCAAKHKGTDKPRMFLCDTTGNKRKTPNYALVQASTACTTISIQKEYMLRPSGSMQQELVGFTNRGRGRKRLSVVEQ